MYPDILIQKNRKSHSHIPFKWFFGQSVQHPLPLPLIRNAMLRDRIVFTWTQDWKKSNGVRLLTEIPNSKIDVKHAPTLIQPFPHHSGSQKAAKEQHDNSPLQSNGCNPWIYGKFAGCFLAVADSQNTAKTYSIIPVKLQLLTAKQRL